MSAPEHAAQSFREEYLHVAAVIYELGGTDALVARALQVGEKDIATWTKDIEVFRQIRREGQRRADNCVEMSLFKRANGYEYEEEKVVVCDKQVVKVPYRKHMPADPRAGMYWLMNRHSEQWRTIPKLTKVKEETGDDPLSALIKSMSGTTVRPKEESARYKAEEAMGPTFG